MLGSFWSRPISMRFEFSRQIFEKSSKIKFHDNQSNWRQVIACGRTEGQTDRHDDANSRFSQFWERA